MTPTILLVAFLPAIIFTLWRVSCDGGRATHE
jgi:hypothetical protein